MKVLEPHNPAWGLYSSPLSNQSWEVPEAAQVLALEHMRNQLELGIEEWDAWAKLLTEELGMDPSSAAIQLTALSQPQYHEVVQEHSEEREELDPRVLLFPDEGLGYIPSQHHPQFQWIEAQAFIHWPSCGEMLTEFQRRSRRIHRLQSMTWRHNQAMTRTITALKLAK